MLAETPLSPEGDNMFPTGVVETHVFTAEAGGEATGPWLPCHCRCATPRCRQLSGKVVGFSKQAINDGLEDVGGYSGARMC